MSSLILLIPIYINKVENPNGENYTFSVYPVAIVSSLSILVIITVAVFVCD